MAEKPPSIRNFYELKEKIGTGRFGTVRKAIQKATNQTVAIKVVKKSKVDYSKLLREINVMRNMSHPHIVHFIDAVETSSKVYLVMEYCNGGELLDRIINKRSYSEQEASEIFKQILLAVSYMHSNNVIHRDLKPENILFSTIDGHEVVKIADFGLARLDIDIDGKPVPLETQCGTPAYISPEILRKQPYDYHCDCWSLGVVLYTMMSGFAPFTGNTNAQMFNKIITGKYSFVTPFCDHFSDDCKNLIGQMLIVDPTQRINIDQALLHPFIVRDSSSDHMTNVVDQMKVFNARRKLRSAVLSVQILHKLNNLCNQNQHRSESE
ncbi:hypothetical protein GEMRC1_005021 [Eukaryota sp. GEM-RC1]